MMVLCLIPVVVLVMLPDLLRSLQYLQPFLLQNGSPLSFLVVPWCVLGMSPLERDPEAVIFAGLLVKGCRGYVRSDKFQHRPLPWLLSGPFLKAYGRRAFWWRGA